MNGSDETKPHNWFKRHKMITTILVIVGVVVVAALVVALLPFRIKDVPQANPAASYEAAMRRLEAITAEQKQDADINPLCYTRAMTHGQETENVIILLHGFTSCPQQMEELGEVFFEKGYNVIIPREPHHGELERIENSTPKISAEELAAFAMETVDIAHGLGEKVTVMGLSGGGTIATWLAQERDDIHLSVPIAPFLGIGFIPTPLNRPVAQILDDIPNIWQWWDPVKKENNPHTGEYQYPRYGTHGLAEYMRLGYAALNDARKEAPTGKIIMVSNAADSSVSNGIIDRFLAEWDKHNQSGAAVIKSFRFPKEENLPHDTITPQRDPRNTTLVYPKILELLGLE